MFVLPFVNIRISAYVTQTYQLSFCLCQPYTAKSLDLHYSHRHTTVILHKSGNVHLLMKTVVKLVHIYAREEFLHMMDSSRP